MKLNLGILTTLFGCLGWTAGLPRPLAGTDIELISNGSSYIFTNMLDGGAITVLPNGEVITEIYSGKEEQKWTLVEHPLDPLCLEFKNFVTPYNDLSGYKDPEDNPGVFPRPLTVTKFRIMPDLGRNPLSSGYLPPIPWEIVIRNRWCLQTTGLERRLTIDDCEWEPSPWQYWQLEEVALAPKSS